MRTMRLNGWQRMWIVMAVLWLAGSGVAIWSAWLQPAAPKVYLDAEGREYPEVSPPGALKTRVQQMIDSGEPEDRIASFIRGYPPEVVIVDGDREHVFPPGTDPK